MSPARPTSRGSAGGEAHRRRHAHAAEAERKALAAAAAKKRIGVSMPKKSTAEAEAARKALALSVNFQNSYPDPDSLSSLAAGRVSSGVQSFLHNKAVGQFGSVLGGTGSKYGTFFKNPSEGVLGDLLRSSGKVINVGIGKGVRSGVGSHKPAAVRNNPIPIQFMSQSGPGIEKILRSSIGNTNTFDNIIDGGSHHNFAGFNIGALDHNLGRSTDYGVYNEVGSFTGGGANNGLGFFVGNNGLRSMVPGALSNSFRSPLIPRSPKADLVSLLRGAPQRNLRDLLFDPTPDFASQLGAVGGGSQNDAASFLAGAAMGKFVGSEDGAAAATNVVRNLVGGPAKNEPRSLNTNPQRALRSLLFGSKKAVNNALGRGVFKNGLQSGAASNELERFNDRATNYKLASLLGRADRDDTEDEKRESERDQQASGLDDSPKTKSGLAYLAGADLADNNFGNLLNKASANGFNDAYRNFLSRLFQRRGVSGFAELAAANLADNNLGSLLNKAGANRFNDPYRNFLSRLFQRRGVSGLAELAGANLADNNLDSLLNNAGGSNLDGVTQNVLPQLLKSGEVNGLAKLPGDNLAGNNLGNLLNKAGENKPDDDAQNVLSKLIQRGGGSGLAQLANADSADNDLDSLLDKGVESQLNEASQNVLPSLLQPGVATNGLRDATESELAEQIDGASNAGMASEGSAEEDAYDAADSGADKSEPSSLFERTVADGMAANEKLRAAASEEEEKDELLELQDLVDRAEEEQLRELNERAEGLDKNSLISRLIRSRANMELGKFGEAANNALGLLFGVANQALGSFSGAAKYALGSFGGAGKHALGSFGGAGLHALGGFVGATKNALGTVFG